MGKIQYKKLIENPHNYLEKASCARRCIEAMNIKNGLENTSKKNGDKSSYGLKVAYYWMEKVDKNHICPVVDYFYSYLFIFFCEFVILHCVG